MLAFLTRTVTLTSYIKVKLPICNKNAVQRSASVHILLVLGRRNLSQPHVGCVKCR